MDQDFWVGLATIAVAVVIYLAWRNRSRDRVRERTAAPPHLPGPEPVVTSPAPARHQTDMAPPHRAIPTGSSDSSGPSRPPPASHSICRVFYATDRARVSLAPPTYGGERDALGELHLGYVDVSIPRDHRMGQVERPTIWTLWSEDITKHFVFIEGQELVPEVFFPSLAMVVGQSPAREAFVFVHGFHVEFQDAVYRTAQIAYDLGFLGAPILYSWPSEGKYLRYPVDLNNNEWTIPHLRAFLQQVAARSGADVIHLIAHSMGNRALVYALTQMSMAQPLFNQVILTAPDIDADALGELSAALQTKGRRVTLYASSNDRALVASRTFQGYRRAGDSDGQVLVMRGIDTIDVSAVDTNFVGHFYYGDNRSVLSDIYWLIRDGRPPAERFGLQPIGAPPQVYWAFRP